MKFLTKEVKIAIVGLTALVLLFLGLDFLKGLSVFSDDDDYYITFKDISGLSASNPIFADGYQVGVVKGISYNYDTNDDIVVCFSVNKNLRIPEGTSAEIVSDLMGNVKMNLLLANNPRKRVEPGDTIIGAINSGNLGRLAAMIPDVEKLLPKLDSILASLNMLLADPSIKQTLHNIEGVSANLKTSSEELNTLMASLNRDVPTVLTRTNNVLANAEQLSGNLAELDLQQTMNEVNQTITNVKLLTERLNDNKGTLGLLMNDPQLYHQLNHTMKSADTLLIDLRQHPKRYVHFSVFGKKE